MRKEFYSIMALSPKDTVATLEKDMGGATPAKAAGAYKRVRIILEENDDIPPTGLFVGHNGTGYLISPGEEVEVPEPLLEILNHATSLVPQVDPQTRQVIGYRSKMRYPYRRVSG